MDLVPETDDELGIELRWPGDELSPQAPPIRQPGRALAVRPARTRPPRDAKEQGSAQRRSRKQIPPSRNLSEAVTLAADRAQLIAESVGALRSVGSRNHLELQARVAAVLNELRGPVADFRRMCRQLSRSLEGRAESQIRLQAQMAKLSHEMHSLRRRVTVRGGSSSAVGEEQLGAIARAIVERLTAELVLPGQDQPSRGRVVRQ